MIQHPIRSHRQPSSGPSLRVLPRARGYLSKPSLPSHLFRVIILIQISIFIPFTVVIQSPNFANMRFSILAAVAAFSSTVLAQGLLDQIPQCAVSS